MKRIKQKLHIRTKLIGIFALFTTLALCTLIAFQGVFLDDFYQTIKIAGMKRAVQDIKQAVEEGETPSISDWSVAEDIGMYVFTSDGERLDTNYSLGYQGAPLMKNDLKTIYQRAQQDGGVFFAKRQHENNFSYHGKSNRELKPHNRVRPPTHKINNIVLYGEILHTEDPAPMVLAITNVTPVDAVTRTLTMQSIMASFVIVAMAIIMAVILAKYIASPIEALNTAAKGLSDGSYVSPPQQAGYMEAVQLQQTMDQVAVELQKTDQLQRELIANVSHDLRTPLTMITGYGEAIRDLPGEDVAENIQVVIDEANRLTLLVNDLLDLSKLQAGRQTLDMVPVDVSSFLQEIVERFSRMMEFQDCRLMLSKTDKAMVKADVMRLSQAVYNLIGNAIYHCGEDRTVYIEQCVTDTTVRIAFSDHGEGIPEEALEHIWERYYQVRRGDAGSFTPTHSGLGLSIVKSVVTLHGGTCGVSSVLGQGSTFWVELPRI